MMALSQSSDEHDMPLANRRKSPWLKPYKATASHAPSDTLTKALALFESETQSKRRRYAVDLGCGGGRDTLELLRRGWRVLAVDSEPEIIQWVRSTVPPKHRAQLQARVALFDELRLPKCDLINASYSLPFCPPDQFDSLWRKIVSSLCPRGRFAGHLFGIRDDWSKDIDKTFHTIKQINNLLGEFEVEDFLEVEREGTTASGRRKHWHVFSIVARKA
jgi:tellurite methyltransferase